MNVAYTLGVKRRQIGAKDEHGKPAKTYAAATDWSVYGYAPGASGPGLDGGTDRPNRDLSIVQWTVYAPADDSAPTELDRVVLDGDEYDVFERPADWTKGPWPHPTAGLVVLLKRAEG